MKNEKKNYSKEDVEKFYSEYLNTDCTITSIYEKYGWTLKRLFKDYGFSARKNRNGRYKLNWIGDSIQNEFEAYFIGFLYADGYIGENNQVGINLKNQESEFNLLTQFKDYIIPDQTLKFERNNSVVKLLISSNEFSNNLQNLGVLKNKTYKELNIPVMDESLIRHFIRGYFDADGTVFYDRKYLRANICSINHDFLIKLKNVLDKNEIISTITIETREGKKLKTPQGIESITFKDMYRLNISSKSIKTNFKDYLYNNASIFLTRKKEIFFKENTEVN